MTWTCGLQLPRNFNSANTKLKTIYTLKAINRKHGIKSVVTNAETFDGQRSHDLYGFIDILVDHNRAIQACGTDWQPHIRKMREECPRMVQWWLSNSDRTLELWGWRKIAAYKANGDRAKRDIWMPRIQLLTDGFLFGWDEPIWLDFDAMLSEEHPIRTPNNAPRILQKEKP